MSSKSASAQYQGVAGTLPLTVATIYLGLAVLATVLAFAFYNPIAFVPLLILSAPFGIMLLDRFDTMNLFLQSLFLALGIGINAWLVGMAVSGIRAAWDWSRRRG